VALAVSVAGNHRDIVPELFGKAPASPTPNKKRMVINVNSPVVAPVNAVNKDHHKTMRIKTARCPMRSPNMPEGISNKA